MPNFVTIVKYKSFSYKDKISIGQLIWQLYTIVVRYGRFRKMSSFFGTKGRVQSLGSISQKLMDKCKTTYLVTLIIYIYVCIFL